MREGSRVAERDALAFFELLYGPEPPGTILICEQRGKSWQTHACVRPIDAVPYRPRSGRRVPPRGAGRTPATNWAARNGGRHDRADRHLARHRRERVARRQGRVVTDAAPSLEAAVELHQCVLEPTFLVGSGYGAHGYWG